MDYSPGGIRRCCLRRVSLCTRALGRERFVSYNGAPSVSTGRISVCLERRRWTGGRLEPNADAVRPTAFTAVRFSPPHLSLTAHPLARWTPRFLTPFQCMSARVPTKGFSRCAMRIPCWARTTVSVAHASTGSMARDRHRPRYIAGNQIAPQHRWRRRTHRAPVSRLLRGSARVAIASGLSRKT